MFGTFNITQAAQTLVQGAIVDSLNAVGSATAAIAGGSVNELSVSEQATAIIVGGDIGADTIRLFDDGVLNLRGTNLALVLDVPAPIASAALSVSF